MDDLAIIHDDSGTAWAEYINNQITRKYNIPLQMRVVHLEGYQASQLSSIKNTKCQLVLLFEGTIGVYQSHNLTFLKEIGDEKSLCLLLCGFNPLTFLEKLRGMFNNYDNLIKFTFIEDCENPLSVLQGMFKHIMTTVEKCNVPKVKTPPIVSRRPPKVSLPGAIVTAFEKLHVQAAQPPTPIKTPEPVPTTNDDVPKTVAPSVRECSVKAQVIPHITMLGEPLTLIFSEAPSNSSGNFAKIEGLDQQIPLQSGINSHTFSLTLPKDADVNWNKEKLALKIYNNKGQYICGCEVQLKPSLKKLDDMFQKTDEMASITNPFELLCNCIGLDMADPSLLDYTLAAIMKFYEAFSLHHKFVVKECDHTSLESKCSGLLTPTMLHFAAQYGLKEYCAMLVSCRGVNIANDIINISNKFPSQMAEEAGHEEVGAYLQSHSEMTHDLNAIYENAVGTTNANVQDALSQEVHRRGSADPDYMAMGSSNPQKGEDSAQPDYMEMYGQSMGYLTMPSCPVYPGYLRMDGQASGSHNLKVPPKYHVVPSQHHIEGSDEEGPEYEDVPTEEVRADLLRRSMIENRRPQPESYIKQQAAATLPHKLPGGIMSIPGPKPKEPTMGSVRQQELIDIATGYKENEYTMEDVNVLYQNFLLKCNNSTGSFKEKQKSLDELRREIRSKKQQGWFSSIFGNKKKEKDIKIERILPANQSGHKGPRTFSKKKKDVPALHDDTDEHKRHSNSSNASSRSSRDSGSFSDSPPGSNDPPALSTNTIEETQEGAYYDDPHPIERRRPSPDTQDGLVYEDPDNPTSKRMSYSDMVAHSEPEQPPLTPHTPNWSDFKERTMPQQVQQTEEDIYVADAPEDDALPPPPPPPRKTSGNTPNVPPKPVSCNPSARLGQVGPTGAFMSELEEKFARKKSNEERPPVSKRPPKN
ncbi:unnamed protein product [Owenia fusiformis]|uniref:Uncharacterized protein n=1 Tax=Owenia fusiformis TaxID=6347 RepID=A0A8J1U7V6_OWEFU|nr:unnamed protein product [Owenia fusiformis]